MKPIKNNKWLSLTEEIDGKFRIKHGNIIENIKAKVDPHLLRAGTLGGLTFLVTPVSNIIKDNPTMENLITFEKKLKTSSLEMIGKLNKFISPDLSNPSPDEEKEIAQTLSEYFGFEVKPEIDGKRLPRTYGISGSEQHLYRYPGDSLEKHATNKEDRNLYLPEGIAPGLGAYGYFAENQKSLTDQQVQEEKYYIAVQTFLADDFYNRTEEYREFFKFRKMILVNPQTGQACVAVIGDAGPSTWTGKHLGGSPEVMQAVGLGKGVKSGPVIFMFVDDPDNKVPLGPISLEEART